MNDQTDIGSATVDCEKLEALARSSLDDSVASLDAATLSRLNQARQQALEESHRPLLPRIWLPVSATAFAALAIAVVLPLQQAPAPDPAGEFLGASEDAALVEDLDLVLWLMDAEDHASS